MVTEKQIRELAYAIWDEEGQPSGKDKEHWFRAKQFLEMQEVDKAATEASSESPYATLSGLGILLKSMQEESKNQFMRSMAFTGYGIAGAVILWGGSLWVNIFVHGIWLYINAAGTILIGLMLAYYCFLKMERLKKRKLANKESLSNQPVTKAK